MRTETRSRRPALRATRQMRPRCYGGSRSMAPTRVRAGRCCPTAGPSMLRRDTGHSSIFTLLSRSPRQGMSSERARLFKRYRLVLSRQDPAMTRASSRCPPFARWKHSSPAPIQTFEISCGDCDPLSNGSAAAMRNASYLAGCSRKQNVAFNQRGCLSARNGVSLPERSYQAI